MKIFISIIVLMAATSGIVGLFWQQEVQYLLPTPVPTGFQPKQVGFTVDLKDKLPITSSKPLFLHFFNPACPCSRFNLKHFLALVENHQDSVDFYAVIPEGSDQEKATRLLKNKIHLLVDENQMYSKACGVYASPQAVLLNKKHQIFYKGNYNKARYCTKKESNYAEIAITLLLSDAKTPDFGEEATTAYGCLLPGKD